MQPVAALGAEARFEPERVVHALNAAGVSYVVVGGLAVAAHGVVRATRDLDLVADSEPANMERLAGALGKLGGEHPVDSALTADNLARPISMKVLTRVGEVHVLNRMPGTPAFSEIHADRVLVEIADDVEVPICSLRHLRQMKRASDRPRDAVDLIELDELHGREDS